MPGKRTEKHCRAIVEEVKARTGDRTDLLLTSDEHAPYESAIKATCYNFCWPVRTLRERSPNGLDGPCTPAMSAGLTAHIPAGNPLHASAGFIMWFYV